MHCIFKMINTSFTGNIFHVYIFISMQLRGLYFNTMTYISKQSIEFVHNAELFLTQVNYITQTIKFNNKIMNKIRPHM